MIPDPDGPLGPQVVALKRAGDPRPLREIARALAAERRADRDRRKAEG